MSLKKCPNCGNPEVKEARCDICASFGSFYPFEILAILAFVIVVGCAVVYLATGTIREQSGCLFYTEAGDGQGGYSVCDDAEASFRTAFEQWGLQKIGYPISRRYIHNGFVTQAFQKAIMQWQPESGRVVLANVFDELHNAGFDDILLSTRQTPRQLPPRWDRDIEFDEIIRKRQALLDVRPALHAAYFASDDPLTFYGLPTSEVQDMGNHYAIRLQRTVLQEWKEDVSWARASQVTQANTGDIAKELGLVPTDALIPESVSPTPTAP